MTKRTGEEESVEEGKVASNDPAAASPVSQPSTELSSGPSAENVGPGQEEHAPAEPDPQLRRRSRIAVLKYGLARLALFIVLTAAIEAIAVLIGAYVPVLFAAVLALFVALPLSMLVFTKWRVDATESLAEYSRQRKEHKAWIQRELAGR